jgi:pimeloyl-ACP methyl ester carboxylesterase
VDTAVKCATLDVIENRETNTGRKISLNIVVLPASARIKEPDPIFLFAGGPGQAATDLAMQANMILGQLNTKRDIVLIDQRGTGKSNPLTCKLPEVETMEMADAAMRRTATLKFVTECRDKLAQKADLSHYGSTTAMADYDEVRAALGAEKINLWGGSYGTRTAQEYLRRYPDRVRTVTLDGVASPSLALPENFARDAGAALEAVFVSCEKSEVCAKKYPNLRADFTNTLESLRKTPRKITMPDPLTNLPRDIVLSDAGFLGSVFMTLYAPQMAAMLPEVITSAAKGNFTPISALSGSTMGGMEESIAFGMRLSVSCNEDVPRITAAQREAAKKIAPFGDWFINEFSTACEVWPKGKVKDDFFTPVKSEKPVLIFSGGLDPVTPKSFGEEVKKNFSNSLHIVAPNIGHGVAHQACGPQIVKKFVETASVAGLDGKCFEKLPRPTFYQPMAEKKDKEGKDKDGKDKDGAKEMSADKKDNKENNTKSEGAK